MVAGHDRTDSSQHQPSSPREFRSSQRVNDDSELAGRKQPWFKRPSLTWILCMKAFSSIAGAVTAGPRVEIYTELVCRGYSYTPGRSEDSGFLPLPGSSSNATFALDEPVIPIELYFPHNEQAHSSSAFAVALGHFPKPSGGCASDPNIQAEVAKLLAVLGIIGGILSCLTTGWWGGFLDRYGRTRTMGINIFGPLFSDSMLLLVFHFSAFLPVNYWILVICPIFEGLLGVPSSTFTSETAYMRDISEPHNLARNFSLLVGIFYAGSTIGPAIGGLINHQTGNVISAFYVTCVAHLAYAMIVWFILPESFSEAAMAQARTRYADELSSVAGANVGAFRRQVMMLIKSFWDSFPLNVLAPKRSPHSKRKDWNLTWLAISAGLINAIMGSANSVYQYGLYTYHWSSLDLGYFISASGLSTVIFLTVIFPSIISVWKRSSDSTQGPQANIYNAAVDLTLLRLSAVFVAAGYGLMGISPTGFVFTVSYVITTFGQGFLPTIQSVAAILHASDDTGRLFGALGVVYVLGGRILGPALYGAVFVNTVAFFPSAILWLSVVCAMSVLLVLAFIRLAHRVSSTQDTEQRPGESESESDPLLDS